MTENYSYADLKGLICNSQLKAIDRVIDQHRSSFVEDSKVEANDQKLDDEEGIINTNNIDEDKVYFKQEDILSAFSEIGNKSNGKNQNNKSEKFSPLIADDVKKQKQILM